MGMEGIWGWDRGANIWRRVLVNPTGYLQTVVVSSALPAGGATAANQATIIGHIDDIEGALGQCYGYDGGAWQTLLVESDVLKNLRVKLYDGANGIDSQLTDTGLTTERGLVTCSQIYGYRAANDSRVIGTIHISADARTPSWYGLVTSACLYGFNGTNFDRLRVDAAFRLLTNSMLYDGANAIDSDLIDANIFVSGERALLVRAQVCGYNLEPFHQRRSDSDGLAAVSRELCQMTVSALYAYNGATFDRLRTYPSGILKVGRAEIDSTTVRVTAAGAVAGGVRRLYWVACSPDAVNAEWELTDAVAGGGAVRYDHFDQDRSSEHLVFDPPMKFTTGIWVEKFDHMKSLTFCYI